MKRKRQLAKQLEANNSVKKAAAVSTSDTPVAVPKKVLPPSIGEKPNKEDVKVPVIVSKKTAVASAVIANKNENDAATLTIANINEKLQGYEEGTYGEQQTVEGQVRLLINAA